MAPKRDGQVTLADVAARALVDRSVVSRVISGDPRLNIRPETHQRVLDAIEELQYRPNRIARSLRTRKADTIGLIIPDFMNPVYASIIVGAEEAAAARDCVLLTGSISSGAPSVEGYLDLLGRGRVDGLLLASAPGDVERIRDLAIPYMFINRRPAGARRYVILDDERAAELAVEYLSGLGHRRIAHISGPRSADTASRREAGYRRAMQKVGLRVARDHVVSSDYSSRAGADAMRALLSQSPRPTAVFVANIAAAVGALACAHATGVKVPDELSVITVHDLPMADYLIPSLTTLRMPLEKLGNTAVELLATQPKEARIEEVVDGPIELVERGSTGPAPAR